MDRIHRFFRKVVLFVALAGLMLQPKFTQAESINISATVASSTPEQTATAVIIQGFAYPGTNVTIRENGEVISIVPADSQAVFNTTIENIDPGIYTFSIRGEDSAGRNGPTTNVTVFVSAGITVTITGVFLGPTIELADHTIAVDETTTLLGISAANSNVSIFVTATDDQKTTYSKLADQHGLYSKSILGSTLSEGKYTVQSRAVATDGTISDASNALNLKVSGVVDTSTCADAIDSDINCDGEVNLIDFSIMLFWWNQSHPDNSRADINNDGLVDIIDFSIMLYYWTASL